MYVYIHTYIHTYIHACIHTYIISFFQKSSKDPISVSPSDADSVNCVGGDDTEDRDNVRLTRLPGAVCCSQTLRFWVLGLGTRMRV